jgi:hypothetical protein
LTVTSDRRGRKAEITALKKMLVDGNPNAEALQKTLEGKGEVESEYVCKANAVI